MEARQLGGSPETSPESPVRSETDTGGSARAGSVRAAAGRSLGFERGVTILVGVLATLGGLFVLLVGAGAFGIFRAQRTVIDPLAVQWLRSHPQQAVAAGVAIGLVLLVVGIWWITRTLRPETHPHVRLGRGASGGTSVTSAALTDAVRADARTVTGVTRVRVRTTGTPRRIGLRMVLSLQEGTDVRQVWEELDHKVLDRARQALETEVLPTAIRLELDRAPRQRVK